MNDKEIVKGYCQNNCGKNHSFNWFTYASLNFCGHHCMEQYFTRRGRKQKAEENKEALAFFEHLQNHPEVKNAPLSAGIPICKICNKNSREILKEKLQKEAEK